MFVTTCSDIHIEHCTENAAPVSRLQKTDGGKMMVQREAEQNREQPGPHAVHTDGQLFLLHVSS